MNKKILHIFVIIILAILFTGIGMFIGNNSLSSVEETLCVSPDTIKQNTMAELEQKLNLKIKDSLIPFFSKEKRISASLTGEILAIDVQANTLKIQVKNRYEGGDFFEYLNEPNSYIKTVKISGETEIVRQEIKKEEEIEKERQAYSKDNTGMPPLPYKLTEISINNLKEDMEITVKTETEIKLQQEEDIDAKEITIAIDFNY